jgi:ABC-type transport system involved in Fe-S cluster assembly fused permease/ATPase subunit
VGHEDRRHLSRLTGDVDTTTGLLQMAVVSPAISVIRLVIAVIVLFSLNGRLALTALAIVPGVMLVSFASARRVRPIYRSVRKDTERIDGRVGETFSGIRVVRAFRRELRELLEYTRGRHTVLRKELFAHRREMALWTSWGLLLGAVNVVIVWYGGYLHLAGRASVGDIMAFQWYTFLLLNPVWQLVNSFSELQRSLAAMERVFEVLEMEDDKPDRPDATDAPRQVHEIRFERVEFEYREGRPVVRDFDVVAPGRSVIALVGRSGAGKTTVTDLVARFHDPTRGRILVNGTDIRSFRLRSYRDLLGIVQQDVFLFDGSVRDNIAYGRIDATDAEIEDAARRANAHEFIVTLRAVRDVHRRARRQALRRTAAAAGDRPGDPGVAPDPDPRRGHQQPGHRERAVDPGFDGDAARRANHLRDRASALHDPARRPDPVDGGRAGDRAGDPPGADGRPGGVLPDGPAPDGIARPDRRGAVAVTAVTGRPGYGFGSPTTICPTNPSGSPSLTGGVATT